MSIKCYRCNEVIGHVLKNYTLVHTERICLERGKVFQAEGERTFKNYTCPLCKQVLSRKEHKNKMLATKLPNKL